MKSLTRFMSALFVISVSLPAYCATLLVPEEFPSIQSAINSAVDGDTVSVANGTHTGAGNVDISPNGKAITISSRNGPELCVIDCQGDPMSTHRGFDLRGGEGPDTVIQGFTITNGWLLGMAIDDEGAGIRCEGAAPTIRDCIITGNSAWEGGGLYVIGENESRLCIINTVFSKNTANFTGGGAAIHSIRSTIVNCMVHDNASEYRGGGFLVTGDDVEIRDSTFQANTSKEGGGLQLWGIHSSPSLRLIKPCFCKSL